MSATIFWEPVNPNAKHLDVMAPSHFISCLERAGLGLPYTFGEHEIPILRGMAASMNEDRNPYSQLIEAITENGSISVWCQH